MSTHGERIGLLLEAARFRVEVIAPFIKVGAMRSLLKAAPDRVHFRCVTRWLPHEVAAGVSDPEILDLLEERGNFSLTLVDQLHAKLYIADDRCLSGSVNVTQAGFGGLRDGGNIEILTESSANEGDILGVREDIAKVERVATREMVQQVTRFAKESGIQKGTSVAIHSPWFPRSFEPELAFILYERPAGGFKGSATQRVHSDIVRANLPPGLDKRAFTREIQDRLGIIPFISSFLEGSSDAILSQSDAAPWLIENEGDGFTASDLWRAIVSWTPYFYPNRIMQQEKVEVSLRRAKLLS